METLDRADNMLTGGIFGDFDRLIDDVDDPRLAALRERNTEATGIKGIQEILDELVKMYKDQSRCGLDKPSEEDQSRMRDLVQSVTEQAGPAANRMDDLRKAINGKWRLLYHSESFLQWRHRVRQRLSYHKVRRLATQYMSDGYISESRYYENSRALLGKYHAQCIATGRW